MLQIIPLYMYISNLSQLGVGGNDDLKKHATYTNGIQGRMLSKLEKLNSAQE